MLNILNVKKVIYFNFIYERDCNHITLLKSITDEMRKGNEIKLCFAFLLCNFRT